MTISDCLGASDAHRFTQTLDASLDAPRDREVLETRYLRVIDLRIPIRSTAIDHGTPGAALAA